MKAFGLATVHNLFAKQIHVKSNSQEQERQEYGADFISYEILSGDAAAKQRPQNSSRTKVSVALGWSHLPQKSCAHDGAVTLEGGRRLVPPHDTIEIAKAELEGMGALWLTERVPN